MVASVGAGLGINGVAVIAEQMLGEGGRPDAYLDAGVTDGDAVDDGPKEVTPVGRRGGVPVGGQFAGSGNVCWMLRCRDGWECIEQVGWASEPAAKPLRDQPLQIRGRDTDGVGGIAAGAGGEALGDVILEFPDDVDTAGPNRRNFLILSMD